MNSSSLHMTLLSINSYRNFLLEKIFFHAPMKYYKNSGLVPVYFLIVTIIIIIKLFLNTKGLSIFSFHPLFMSIGTFLFISQGIISYQNNILLDLLSPIMQHNKKTKSRAIHQSFNIIGTVFIGLGMISILLNKSIHNKTIIPHTVHSVSGLIFFSFLLIQIYIGQTKKDHLENIGRKVYNWHGDMGFLIWDLLCLSLITGILSYFSIDSSLFMILTMVILAWLIVHAHFKTVKLDTKLSSYELSPLSKENREPIERIEDNFIEENNLSDKLETKI